MGFIMISGDLQEWIIISMNIRDGLEKLNYEQVAVSIWHVMPWFNCEGTNYELLCNMLLNLIMNSSWPVPPFTNMV